MQFSFLFDRQFESDLDELRAGLLDAGQPVGRGPRRAAAGAVGVARRAAVERFGRNLGRVVAEAVVVHRIGHGDEGVEDLRRPGRRAATLHRQQPVDRAGGGGRQVHVQIIHNITVSHRIN